MKIVMIIGSGCRNGNTDRASKIIKEEMESAADQAGVSFECETIYLGAAEIRACRGCRACFDRGEEACPVKDDLAGIRQKMRAADGLLVASPVYVDDVSGLVKNWIDRIAHACHRPEFGGKCAYLLVTTGGSPTGHALRTLTVALGTWGYHIVGKLGLATGAQMEEEEIRTRYHSRLQKTARQFFSAIHDRQYLHPTFLSLMMFRIQQTTWVTVDPQSVDYSYWHNQGWLKPSSTYYFSHQGNPLKTMLARLVGSVISRIVG